eukprot:scaffold97622_cov21-Phaeocystis_antarctica.AAC.1
MQRGGHVAAAPLAPGTAPGVNAPPPPARWISSDLRCISRCISSAKPQPVPQPVPQPDILLLCGGGAA